jgi:ASC-1-like (ASCH) protein
MNLFEYKIYDAVYNDMISGKKTIEFRLLNEKTESIKIGDEIKFKVLDDDKKYVLVNVLNKYIYDDIDDLWRHKEILNNLLNYTKDELVTAFYEIFGKEKVMNSKIVGIEFKVKEFN